MQWNMKYEQLVEFKRTNGHCMVPCKYKQDKSLWQWVRTQRRNHNNNKMRPDRKKILDEIGFVWKLDGTHTMYQYDKLWHKQYEKIVEFKRKNGHCLVPKRYEQDKSLGQWVLTQRKARIKNKGGLDRKRLLDEIGFAWKYEGVHNHNHTHDDKICHQKHVQLDAEPAAQENRKLPSTCLAESGEMAASTNKRENKATGSSCSTVDEVIGRHEKVSKPSAVTSSAALIGSSTREAVQEEATHGEIPSCWKVCFPI
jgi:hypothetical protein